MKSNSVFHKDIAHTLKQTKQRSKDRGPQEDVVDNNATAEVSGVGRVTRFVQSFPFAFENAHHTSVERRSIAGSKRHDAKTILIVVRGEEGELFLIMVADSNLVVSGFVIKGDEEEAACRIAEIINSIVASGDRVLKRQGNLVQTTIRDAHAPNEIDDIHNVFLVRFGGKDNGRAPRPETFPDPAVGFEDVNVGHDDLTLVRSVVGFLAADRRRGASVDSKFEIENRKLDACAVEAVPVRLNDVDDSGADLGSNIEANDEVLGKFWKVSFTIPQVDVGADVGKRFRWVAEGSAELFELEDALVKVVAVIHGDIAVDRFGAPYLGWNIDDKGTSKWGKRVGRWNRRSGG